MQVVIQSGSLLKTLEASLSVLRMKLYSLLVKYCFDYISMTFSNMLFCQKGKTKWCLIFRYVDLNQRRLKLVISEAHEVAISAT